MKSADNSAGIPRGGEAPQKIPASPLTDADGRAIIGSEGFIRKVDHLWIYTERWAPPAPGGRF